MYIYIIVYIFVYYMITAGGDTRHGDDVSDAATLWLAACT